MHLVLYFFGGSHSVRDDQMDQAVQLARVANILPVVALADTFSLTTLSQFKRALLERAAQAGIHFFNC